MPKFLNTPTWYSAINSGIELYGVGTPDKIFEAYNYLHFVSWTVDDSPENHSGSFLCLCNQEAAIVNGATLRSFISTYKDDILSFVGYGRTTNSQSFRSLSVNLFVNSATSSTQIGLSRLDLSTITSATDNFKIEYYATSYFTVVDQVCAVMLP